MATIFTRFDTTPANLLVDLKAAILTCTDWADITPTTGIPNTTQTTSLAVSAGTVIVTSTTGMAAGMTVVFEPGTVREEYRTITAVTNATTFTVPGLTYAHASGSVVRYAAIILKATTTRGADMIIDLLDGPPTLNYLQVGFYRAHTGAFNGGTDRLGLKYCLWRANATGTAVTTMPLHVTVSATKEHLFFSIEGPRAWETGATSTQYGSLKTYIFLADLVPYHAADTIPAVVVDAFNVAGIPSNTANQNHIAWVSRNAANNASWTPGKLATLSFPVCQSTVAVGLQRQCTIDGNRYITPYVFFDDAEGIRGRLNKIYNAGDNGPTTPADNPAPVGESLSYDGGTYRLVSSATSDAGGNEVWGALGAVNNNSGGFNNRTIVIALPVS